MVELVPAAGVEADELASDLARYGGRVAESEHDAELDRGRGRLLPSRRAPPCRFASRHGWSALTLAGETYVLGAPSASRSGRCRRGGAEEAAGRRVLAFATATAPSRPDALEPPPGLEPLGLVVIAERLRPDAGATVDFFR